MKGGETDPLGIPRPWDTCVSGRGAPLRSLIPAPETPLLNAVVSQLPAADTPSRAALMPGEPPYPSPALPTSSRSRCSSPDFGRPLRDPRQHRSRGRGSITGSPCPPRPPHGPPRPPLVELGLDSVSGIILPAPTMPFHLPPGVNFLRPTQAFARPPGPRRPSSGDIALACTDPVHCAHKRPAPFLPCRRHPRLKGRCRALTCVPGPFPRGRPYSRCGPCEDLRQTGPGGQFSCPGGESQALRGPRLVGGRCEGSVRP